MAALATTVAATLASAPSSTHPTVAAPEAPPRLFGLSVGLYPEASARHALRYPPDTTPLADLGANALLFAPSLWVEDRHANTIEEGSVSFTELRQVTEAAHRQGQSVVWMPIVQLRHGEANDWRGRLQPESPDAFWQSYTAALARYAEAAETLGVHTLVIGSELNSLADEHQSHRWGDLAAALRRRYAGRLGYSMNHDATDLRGPLPHVDTVGLSAYFPLDGDLEHPDEVHRSWQRHAADLTALSEELGRPLTLFELGYPSRHGSLARPWDHTTGSAASEGTQALGFSAAFSALLPATWLEGLFVWQAFGPGGPYDRGYSPMGKEGERLLRDFFEATENAHFVGKPSNRYVHSVPSRTTFAPSHGVP